MSEKPFKVRNKRKQGWFYVDNEYLNGFGKIIGPIGIAVYVSLCRHASNDEQSCFPSQKTIAEEIGIAERTVKTYISILKKHNIIEVEREKRSRRWISNLYYLLDKSEWNYPSGAPKARDKTIHQGHIKASSGASDDIHQGHQLPPNYTNNNYTKKRETKNPTQDFFNSKDLSILDDFKDKVPEKILKEEAQKFILYWTETNSNGKKQLWQMKPTFDVKRRLAFWLKNTEKWDKQRLSNKPQIIL